MYVHACVRICVVHACVCICVHPEGINNYLRGIYQPPRALIITHMKWTINNSLEKLHSFYFLICLTTQSILLHHNVFAWYIWYLVISWYFPWDDNDIVIKLEYWYMWPDMLKHLTVSRLTFHHQSMDTNSKLMTTYMCAL